MRIRWTTPALRDLEKIAAYVARDKPLAAASLVDRIFNHVDRLANHPRLGRAGRIAGTRELVISDTPFIAPYRVRGDDVEVLAVFHSARKWPGDFD